MLMATAQSPSCLVPGHLGELWGRLSPIANCPFSVNGWLLDEGQLSFLAAGLITHAATGAECHAQPLKRGLDCEEVGRGGGGHAIRKFGTDDGCPRNVG
jgi:hypothetical protein